jgi:hypothetical protein
MDPCLSATLCLLPCGGGHVRYFPLFVTDPFDLRPVLVARPIPIRSIILAVTSALPRLSVLRVLLSRKAALLGLILVTQPWVSLTVPIVQQDLCVTTPAVCPLRHYCPQRSGSPVLRPNGTFGRCRPQFGFAGPVCFLSSR